MTTTSSMRAVKFLLTGAFAAVGMSSAFCSDAAALPAHRLEVLDTSVRPFKPSVTTPTHLAVDPAIEAVSTMSEQYDEAFITGLDRWTLASDQSDAWSSAFEQLYEAFGHADGWDGEGSKAADFSTFMHAETLLELIEGEAPDGPAPLVGVDADGAIVLTWHDGDLAGSGSVFADGTFAYYIERVGRSAEDGEFAIASSAPRDLMRILLG